MKRTILTALMLGAGAAHAGIGEVVQTDDYAWDVNPVNDYIGLDFDAFDDMGGTRILTGVNISVESDYTLTMITENRESFGVESGDWFVDTSLFNNFRLLSSDLLVPGVGGVGFETLTGDLAAADGVEQMGDDAIVWGFEGSLSGSRNLLPFQIGAFQGFGPLDLEIYPFLSLAINAPPPEYDVWIPEHRHNGTVTLTYSYDVVPAPSALALVGLGGIAGIRRRR